MYKMHTLRTCTKSARRSRADQKPQKGTSQSTKPTGLTEVFGVLVNTYTIKYTVKNQKNPATLCVSEKSGLSQIYLCGTEYKGGFKIFLKFF